MDPGENSISNHRVSTDGDQSVCHHSVPNVNDEANTSAIVCSGYTQQFRYTPQHNGEAEITDRQSGSIAARSEVTNTDTSESAAPHTPEEEHSPFGSPGADKTEGCAPSGCTVATTKMGIRPLKQPVGGMSASGSYNTVYAHAETQATGEPHCVGDFDISEKPIAMRIKKVPVRGETAAFYNVLPVPSGSLHSVESPFMSSYISSTNATDNPRFSIEASRRRTFDNSWNSTISVFQLVKAGLYYTGEVDRVRCFHCGIGIQDWERDDDPFIEHFKFSRQCPFLWNKNPDLCSSLQQALEDRHTGRHEAATEASKSSQDTVVADRWIQCGSGRLFRVKTACHYISASGGSSEIRPGTVNQPEECVAEGRLHTYQYNTLAKRMATFVKWPLNVGPTAKQFAEAWFYYTGDGDKVACIGCGGTLSDWEPDDDPMREHRKCYPECSLLK